ncbi:nuclear transport factor 2 family protein [Devosia sp. MC532]|uniref:nuclear transport factor 2 family protein n=1 Tax=Devosia sp. MC532 TaxID=2799788 RepID=UPI0018F78637|nr:nuclear transport factor 2 family protein [Devosia sp. MC532]MBJ7579503.1 nuclear transport factor 2 family protein [Devosia sp. MC532]
MTSSARNAVDRMFQAFNAKDLTGALATVSEDTLWIHHGSQKMPSVRFEGKSGAEKFFATSFTAMTIDYFRPLSFIEQGDIVVVLGEESYVMEGIDGKLTNKWVQIYTVADGLIAKMEEFATSSEATSYAVVV